ncbi:hypothetical protein [Mesorhizobium sp. LNJC405B00]|uniref:phosphotransferase-like protein n=1 Tax=unclassified Mesorhizobium TaxID=325217 RepID=UPI0032AFC8B7
MCIWSASWRRWRCWKRARPRADRLPGLARWQYGRVHNGMDYDLEVDTSRLTPLECARRIQERFRL